MVNGGINVLAQRVWHKETGELQYWVRLEHVSTGTFAQAVAITEVQAKQEAWKNLQEALDKQSKV